METTAVQAIKLALVSATGLSKDALHIYVGLSVFLVVATASRRSLASWLPMGAVTLAAALGELLDLRDDLLSLGYWRWSASLHDVINTAFWPTVFFLLARCNLLLQVRGKQGRMRRPRQSE